MSALSGFKVLELSESVRGEYCGKLLADFGADVIKVEKPGVGSPTRYYGPFAAGEAGVERSGLFAYLNTGKQSLELDLSAEAGIAALDQLRKRVDVVIDDHAIAWLQGLGLDPASIQDKQPALVLCSITPFGQSCAEEYLHAEDLNVMHASGWGYHTPSGSDPALPPLKGAGRFMASYEAGLEAALCISAALFEREESGLGRYIDVSQQEVLASRVDYVLGQMVAGDMDVSTERGAFDLGGPAGIFACNDGYAYIWLSAPAHWDALRQLMGNPAWMDEFPERWLERACTAERVEQCRQYIASWMSQQSKHVIEEAGQKLGLPLVAVNNAGDLTASPQYQFRQFFAEVEHPVIGSAIYPTVPYKLSATPVTMRSPAPLLGQHSAVLLAQQNEQGGLKR